MSTAQPEPKIYRVIRFLASGRSLTRFKAEQAVFDHTLNSTVAEIERRFGLQVDRIPTTVRGFGGVQTRCTKYRLSTQQERDRARAILRGRK